MRKLAAGSASTPLGWARGVIYCANQPGGGGAGEVAPNVGMVLGGWLMVEKWDRWGVTVLAGKELWGDECGAGVGDPLVDALCVRSACEEGFAIDHVLGRRPLGCDN